MAIKSLYKDYFQKSKVFLYPALEIKRGVSVTPIETYVSWKDQYGIVDKKLMCLYHLRSDKEFKAFELKHLFGNKLFDDFFQTDDNLGVYVFDFNTFNDDMDNFAKGKYSKLSPDIKKKIITFFAQSVKYTHVHSYLYPNKYLDLYSNLLAIDVHILKEVGELCTPPDLEKEKLIAEIKDLQIKNITT